MLADRIPDIHQATHVTDAPKRLTDTPPEANIRTITLPPWSAAVYVRDFPQDPDMRSAPAGQVGRGDARGEA
jgi:hypothetical protein